MIASYLRVGWTTSAWVHPCHTTLGQVDLPMALVWGDNDPLFPYAQATHAAERHGLPLLCALGGGHSPLLGCRQGARMGAYLVGLALARAARPKSHRPGS